MVRILYFYGHYPKSKPVKSSEFFSKFAQFKNIINLENSNTSFQVGNKIRQLATKLYININLLSCIQVLMIYYDGENRTSSLADCWILALISSILQVINKDTIKRTGVAITSEI